MAKKKNAPATLARVREQIAKLREATDETGLLMRRARVSGWATALLTEGLIDTLTYDQLWDEWDAARDARLAELENPPPDGPVPTPCA